MRNSESGQATLLVVLGMGIFLIGAAGLAIDGSNLYANRQMAQAAADAAAQAGILSIFDGTNSVTANTYKFTPTTTAINCSTTPNATPCYYAQTMNGFNASTDTVTYDIPSITVPGLSTVDPVNLLRVTVSRNVSTSLMALLGPTFSTVSASGVAAIVSVASPVPIIVTHPTNPSTMSFNGGVIIKICGGPHRSIQVNSSNGATQSISGGGSVDLSKAGPPDPGDCSTGTGADFGDFGGPSSPLFTFSGGTTGRYLQPASPVNDPLANVPVPTKPTAGSQLTVAAGNSASVPTTYVSTGSVTCPATTSPGGCDFFLPGDYPSGISVKGSSNYVAYFFPGLYYIDSTGLQNPGGDMKMYPGANSDTSTHACTPVASSPCSGTGAGMLVYQTGNSTFGVGANGNASLVGSDNTSDWKGILFFQDRSSPAHIKKNSDDHIIGGGGALSLTGTIYINNSLSVVTSSSYQLLQLQGKAGSGTILQGEIITNELLLGGGGTIQMNLSAAATSIVRQVALVQ